VIAVSALEVREWMEEQGASAEEPDGEGPPLFLPTPDFMGPQERARFRSHLSLSFVFSFVISLGRFTSSWDRPGRREKGC